LVTKAAYVVYDFFRRAKALPASRSYDAVLVSREAALIGPAIYERLIGWTGKPIIYDFDDSIWSPAQAKTNGLFSRLHFYGKTSSICRLAAAVTAGNDFLADYARQRSKSVFVVPSSIELEDYPLIPEPADDGKFIVCWTGSNSTLAHFEHARPALEKLAKATPLTVKVICNKPPRNPIAGAEMRFVPWSADREAAELSDCHAGIMPLPEDEVTRGKCGMKALQFMAVGRPVVISPVGVNADIVQHRQNGFLAATTDDFVHALLELSKDPGLRCRVGRNARKTVEERYSAEIAARKFSDVVRVVVR
jgi:glycosyltransferase involved in cell wall biosynthesis